MPAVLVRRDWREWGLFEIQDTAGWKEGQSCSHSLFNTWRELRGREQRERGYRAGEVLFAQRASRLHELICVISEQGLTL